MLFKLLIATVKSTFLPPEEGKFTTHEVLLTVGEDELQYPPFVFTDDDVEGLSIGMMLPTFVFSLHLF